MPTLQSLLLPTQPTSKPPSHSCRGSGYTTSSSRAHMLLQCYCGFGVAKQGSQWDYASNQMPCIQVDLYKKRTFITKDVTIVRYEL